MTLSEDILAIPYHNDWGRPSENILVGDERNVITFRRALKLAAELARRDEEARREFAEMAREREANPDPAMQAAALAAYRDGDYQTSREFIAELKQEEQVLREWKENNACKVCGNTPDDEGWIEHGRGCYTQSSDGGGFECIELPSQAGKESK